MLLYGLRFSMQAFSDPNCIYIKCLYLHYNLLPDDKFQTSKLNKFADDYFKFDKNGRKLSKCVENTVGKGEIARYEQFLLFPQCFQRACFPGASKGVIVWEWDNLKKLNIHDQISVMDKLYKTETNLRVQLLPVPVCPMKHEQLNDPGMFVHCCIQSSVPLKHSSLSEMPFYFIFIINYFNTFYSFSRQLVQTRCFYKT